jgi:hypothetical protein
MSDLLKTKTRPGPWRWCGNTGSHSIYLATVHGGRIFVMNFERWGMRGATPRFQVKSRMVKAADLVRFEVGDRDIVGVDAAKKSRGVYRRDVSSIDHPDARLIEAAAELRLLLARALQGGIDDALRAEAIEVLLRIEDGAQP